MIFLVFTAIVYDMCTLSAIHEGFLSININNLLLIYLLVDLLSTGKCKKIKG